MKIDTLSSVEFDLTEAIKDLIYSIKSTKEDVETIKKHLNLPKNDKNMDWLNDKLKRLRFS